MNWLDLVAYFFGGAFVTNAIPNVVAGFPVARRRSRPCVTPQKSAKVERRDVTGIPQAELADTTNQPISHENIEEAPEDVGHRRGQSLSRRFGKRGLERFSHHYGPPRLAQAALALAPAPTTNGTRRYPTSRQETFWSLNSESGGLRVRKWPMAPDSQPCLPPAAPVIAVLGGFSVGVDREVDYYSKWIRGSDAQWRPR